VSGPGLHFSTSTLRSQAALFAGVFPRKQGRAHRHAENLCPLLPKYNHSIMKEPLYSTIEIVFQLLRQLPVLFHQQIGFSTLAQHTTALLYTTSQPNDDIRRSAAPSQMAVCIEPICLKAPRSPLGVSRVDLHVGLGRNRFDDNT
jgi:hypothetical protein